MHAFTDFVSPLVFHSHADFVQGQVSQAESTFERQKLRAQALADEVGALIEQAARKLLGETLCPSVLASCDGIMVIARHTDVMQFTYSSGKIVLYYIIFSTTDTLDSM